MPLPWPRHAIQRACAGELSRVTLHTGTYIHVRSPKRTFGEVHRYLNQSPSSLHVHLISAGYSSRIFARQSCVAQRSLLDWLWQHAHLALRVCLLERPSPLLKLSSADLTETGSKKRCMPYGMVAGTASFAADLKLLSSGACNVKLLPPRTTRAIIARAVSRTATSCSMVRLRLHLWMCEVQ